jgi:putative MATE family efflux protein
MEDNPAASRTTEETPNLVTEGHIWRAVWYLSWPTIISMFLQTAYGYINMIFVGRVSTAAVAAVGIGNQLLFVQVAVLSGVSVGTSALVARFTGARNLDEANEATRQSVILAVAVTVITGVVGIFTSSWLLGYLGAKADVLPIAALYLNINLAGGIPVYLLAIYTTVFRAIGDVKTPLYAMILATLINVLFDWLLVFGIGPFPRMGAPGTAVSVVISRSIALLVVFYALARSPLKSSLNRWWEIHPGWFSRITRIGIPAAFQSLLRSGNGLIYIWIFGQTALATTNIAALTIGLRAESLAYMPGFAFSTAATALVGQNLGARRPDRASRAGWVAAGQGVIVMALLGALFFIFAHPFARLFSQDHEVNRLVVWYLRINALSEPFLALSMILTGALQGAGETRWPTIVTFLYLYLIRLPITYLLMVRYDLSVIWAWWIMTGSVVVGGLLTAVIFLRGRWHEIEV